MRKDKKINSAILVIGDEILSGRTQDLNVSFLSKWLNENCGITVDEVRIIHDEEQIISPFIFIRTGLDTMPNR